MSLQTNLSELYFLFFPTTIDREDMDFQQFEDHCKKAWNKSKMREAFSFAEYVIEMIKIARKTNKAQAYAQSTTNSVIIEGEKA